MKDLNQIREQLCSVTDIEWFYSICEILRKENYPTTHLLTGIIGVEKPNPFNEIRGSKFLDTYDKRFKLAYINPDIAIEDIDQPLDYLGFWGNSFNLRIGELAARFVNYKTAINTYDGGTQIFFYPIPTEFEFSAIGCWSEKEAYEISNLADLEVNSVTFYFGDRIVQGRDGYCIRR